jgi:hypothetical protein
VGGFDEEASSPPGSGEAVLLFSLLVLGFFFFSFFSLAPDVPPLNDVVGGSLRLSTGGDAAPNSTGADAPLEEEGRTAGRRGGCVIGFMRPPAAGGELVEAVEGFSSGRLGRLILACVFGD